MIADDLQPLAQPIKELKPLSGNPRVGNVEAVMRSYNTFGQRKPIVARRDGTVIAGNHQLEAAKRLGWTEIAVVYVDDDDTTAQAFALADNRTGDLGTYDNEALAEMLEAVSIDPKLLEATAYTLDDIKELVTELEPVEPLGDLDSVPDKAPSKTVRGDVWILGNHRLMCGDCREPSDVDKLMNGSKMNLAFTSPPYAEQRTYDETSGFKPIPPEEYVEWFEMVQANVAKHLSNDGSWFVNIRASAQDIDRSLYVMDLVIAHARSWDWHFAEEFCWERNGVPKSPVLRFKNQWEPVFQFVKNRWKFRPDSVRHSSDNFIIPLGKGAGDTSWANKQGNGSMFDQRQIAKKRKSNAQRQGDSTDEWFNGQYSEGLAYPINRLPTFAGSHQATGHTAAFPVGLPEFFVKAYTDEKDTVYDPFMGSGSTLLAAHNQNRIAFGMEISTSYCDIICKRFQQATGIKPIAESTGNEHDFLIED